METTTQCVKTAVLLTRSFRFGLRDHRFISKAGIRDEHKASNQLDTDINQMTEPLRLEIDVSPLSRQEIISSLNYLNNNWHGAYGLWHMWVWIDLFLIHCILGNEGSIAFGAWPRSVFFSPLSHKSVSKPMEYIFKNTACQEKNA